MDVSISNLEIAIFERFLAAKQMYQRKYKYDLSILKTIYYFPFIKKHGEVNNFLTFYGLKEIVESK